MAKITTTLDGNQKEINSSNELLKKKKCIKKTKEENKIKFHFQRIIFFFFFYRQVPSHWGASLFQYEFKFTSGYFNFIHVLAKFMSYRSFPENKIF